LVQRAVADQARQDEADDAGHQRRHLLGDQLERRIEPTPLWRGDFDQIGDRRAELTAHGEALQQPAGHHQRAGPAANHVMTWDQGDGHDAESHQQQRRQHRRLAAHAIRHPTHHHRAQRPHQEARPEGGQRRQQRMIGIAGREEGAADLGGEEREHQEVVEFQRRSRPQGQDLAGPQRSMRILFHDTHSSLVPDDGSTTSAC
jgi:hypothetical protein